MKDISVTEEFKKIVGCIIYLDTNVISYLNDPLNIKDEYLKNNVVCARYMISNLIDINSCAFPYSDAHLRDIMSGSEDYEAEKIQILSTHSKGWKIASEPKTEFIRLDKYFTIADDFNSLKESYKKASEFSNIIHNSLGPIFEKTSEFVSEQISNSTPNISEKFKETIVESIKNYNANSNLQFLRLNKQIRNTIIISDGKRVKFPNINKDVIQLSKEEMIALTDVALKSSGLPFKNHNDYFKYANETYKINIQDEFTHKVTQLTGLCDLLGITSEKLNKETSFDGIISDIFHLSFGLRSHFFVTEDNNLFIKACFVKKWLGLSTHVMKISDLNAYILKQHLLKETKESTELRNITLIFNNDNGEKIGECSFQL